MGAGVCSQHLTPTTGKMGSFHGPSRSLARIHVPECSNALKIESRVEQGTEFPGEALDHMDENGWYVMVWTTDGHPGGVQKIQFANPMQEWIGTRQYSQILYRNGMPMLSNLNCMDRQFASKCVNNSCRLVHWQAKLSIMNALWVLDKVPKFEANLNFRPRLEIPPSRGGRRPGGMLACFPDALLL